MTDANTDALLDVDPHEPGDVDPELVREALTDGDLEGLVRDRAAEITVTFADQRPGVALDLLPAVIEGIGTDHVNVRRKCVSVVVLLSDEHTDELESTVEPLVGCLDDQVPRTRAFAAKALAAIVEDHPEWFVPHVEALVALVRRQLDDPLEGAPALSEFEENAAERLEVVAEEESKQQFIARATAANLLFEALQSDPAAGVDHVDDLLTAFEIEDATLAAAVSDILAVIGEHDPIAIEGAVEPLIDQLDHHDEQVQARAVKALGFSGDDRAVEPLRALADDEDEDDDLRDLATETADWIEHDTQN